MSSIRVLLADDHTLLRAGVRSLIEVLPDLHVIAEAANGEEALELIALHDPDVALLDIAMPKLNGLEVTARVARDFPRTRVIILSMHVDAQYVRKAIEAGAAGYLVKDAGIDMLEIAIRNVANGEEYLSPPISKILMQALRRGSQVEPGSLDSLTPRQREVLRLIASGHTTKSIARILNVSIKTAETHRTQMMERLDIHDVASLVRFAIKSGLVTLDP